MTTKADADACRMADGATWGQGETHALVACRRSIGIGLIGNHYCVPRAERFEVANQMLVDDVELTRQVRFDVQIWQVGSVRAKTR